MKELINRLIADTPVFFKKLRNIAVAVSGASIAASAYYQQLPQPIIDLVPAKLMQGLAIAGLVAAFMAQLTRTDSKPEA